MTRTTLLCSPHALRGLNHMQAPMQPEDIKWGTIDIWLASVTVAFRCLGGCAPAGRPAPPPVGIQLFKLGQQASWLPHRWGLTFPPVLTTAAPSFLYPRAALRACISPRGFCWSLICYSFHSFDTDHLFRYVSRTLFLTLTLFLPIWSRYGADMLVRLHYLFLAFLCRVFST